MDRKESVKRLEEIKKELKEILVTTRDTLPEDWEIFLSRKMLAKGFKYGLWLGILATAAVFYIALQLSR